MSTKVKCDEHSEHEHRLCRNEKDINNVASSTREYIDSRADELWRDGIIPLRKEIDKMKTWVILGMGSVIIQLVVVLLNLVPKFFGK